MISTHSPACFFFATFGTLCDSLCLFARLQVENEENVPLSGRHGLKPSVSMMSLHGPQPHKHLSDVKDHLFQVPTPPQRRKRAGAAKAVRAATMALGRASSFRKKHKADPWL